MSKRDGLIAAKALIRAKRNWRKDGNPDFKSCCAVVAVYRAVGDNAAYPLVLELAHALPLEKRPYFDAHPVLLVGDYNDDPATKHADIMALFDRAIKRLEAQV
jgi:hypothetical protein